jgi:hypothetical protein
MAGLGRKFGPGADWAFHGPMRPGRSRRWLVPIWALMGLPGAACDFFDELESAPGATASGTDTDTGSTSTGDTSACEVEIDDRCLDQDTVASCGPDDGILTEVDCPTLCGELVSFSCVATGSGQHACWCVEPGDVKTLTCTGLEECLGECDLSESFECADRCFDRTDPATIRLYGALVHCAEAACQDTCPVAPETCEACIAEARIAGEGGCSLPRAVCNDDRDPEEPWP